MSPSGASLVFGPAPSSQRTLDIRRTKSAESKLAPVPGLQSDERPLSHVKDAYFQYVFMWVRYQLGHSRLCFVLANFYCSSSLRT